MATYVIADIEILDGAGFEEYRRQVPGTIARYGGRYLARGGELRVLEGEWTPRRCVILEFPTRAQFDAWWSSAEYQPLRSIRERTTRSNLVVVEGI